MRAWRRSRQWVVSPPSSPVTLANGLNTNVAPSVDPPHRTPLSLTLVPLVTVNTSEPLSPLPTLALTMVWQIWVMFVPLTFTVAQVATTGPRLHPVVRPTLFTVAPTVNELDVALLVIVQPPAITRSLELVDAVRAILPSVFVVPLTYLANAASLRRQRRPGGQPASVVL
jgi:hypothetical protein